MDFMMRVLRQDCRLQADGEIQHLLCDTYKPKNTRKIMPLVVPWWRKKMICSAHVIRFSNESEVKEGEEEERVKASLACIAGSSSIMGWAAAGPIQEHHLPLMNISVQSKPLLTQPFQGHTRLLAIHHKTNTPLTLLKVHVPSFPLLATQDYQLDA
ncbi:hypothetical protein F2P79_011306 [Pimephales promelas]|nr:hypothetical protein F2P79_011306 [Pimephales promelas]